MKIKPLITAALLIALVSGCSDCEAHKKFNPNDVKRLLTTKQCRGCDLEWADLRKTNLARADLREAKLAGANLDDANLRGADLTDADLMFWDSSSGGRGLGCEVYYENAYRTSFVNADLSYAKLRSISIPEEGLKGARLVGADLSESNLTGSNLSQVKLNSANLSKTDLGGVNFRNADLSRANLSHTRLYAAHLEKADLRSANLAGASLEVASLQETDLREANLSNADLGWANLQQVIYDDDTDWQGAVYNEQTKFPLGFDPTKKGMRLQSLDKK